VDVVSHRGRGSASWEGAGSLEDGPALWRNIPGDEHRARVGHRLDASGDIGRVAEHLARRLDDNRPGLKTDAGRQLRHALGGVSGIDGGQRAMNGERGTDGPLGVILLRARIAEEGHEPVAEPLQNMPAEPGHCRRGLVEIGVDQAAPILRVEPRCERR
jgi:hypothetical protein